MSAIDSLKLGSEITSNITPKSNAIDQLNLKGNAIDSLVLPSSKNLSAGNPKSAYGTDTSQPANFWSDFIKSLPENLVRGIGLGSLLDIPEAAGNLAEQNSYFSNSNAYKGYTNPGVSLSDIGTGILKTAKSLSEGVLNVVASPAIGTVEEATGQNVGIIKTPFGDFRSPQTNVADLIRGGTPAGEAIATVGANAAVSGGMLVGLGELASPKPKITPSETIEAPAREITPPPETIPKEETSMKLTSGIDPGLEPLYKSDIKPAAQGIAKSAKELKTAINPASASPEAQATADMVRQANATLANAKGLEETRNMDISKAFDKAGEMASIKNIGDYERIGKFSYEPTVGYSKFYKETTDAAHSILHQVYNDPLGYIDNYVRRQFKYGSVGDEKAAINYFQEEASKFASNKSPFISRATDLPLDQVVKELHSRGIDANPVTTNPEILRQWTVANAQHAQLFEGLKKLLNETQDPNVARILNNVTSQGLSNSPTYQGIRSLNNAINQIQLGFSAFHATGTAINAGATDLALGMEKLFSNRDISGVKDIGRSLVPGYSFIRDIYKGHSFIEDLKAGNPAAAKILEEKINPAGARIRIDQAYTNRAYENMKKAFGEGNLIGGTARLPLAVIEQVAKPLMNYAIPRVKIAAFLDAVEAIDKKFERPGPNGSTIISSGVTDAVRAREYGKAWDTMDDRFGLLTHDNLMWSKTARDLSQVGTRSVGWNFGSLRGGIGAVADLSKGDISRRVYFVAALPLYVGTIGAIYQYLHTGKGPTSLIDYFYPKNGLTTPYGPDRVSLPTYMKDVVAYGTDPLGTIEHKTSPLFSIAAALASNHDYYGDLIRNPDDPKMKQLSQVGSYLLDTLKPFSLQSAQRLQEANLSQKTESFLGFTKAPNRFIDPNYKPTLRAPQTPEQKDMAAMAKKAQQEIRQGNMTTFNELKKMGYFNTGSARKTAIKEHYFIQDSKMLPAAREASYQKYIKAKATR